MKKVTEKWQRIIAQEDGFVIDMLLDRLKPSHCVVPYRGERNTRAHDSISPTSIVLLEDTVTGDLIEPYNLFKFSTLQAQSDGIVDYNGRQYKMYYSCPCSNYDIIEGESVFSQQQTRKAPSFSFSSSNNVNNKMIDIQNIALFLNAADIYSFAISCKATYMNLLSWGYGHQIIEVAPVVKGFINITNSCCPWFGHSLSSIDIQKAEKIFFDVYQEEKYLSMKELPSSDFEANPNYKPHGNKSYLKDAIEAEKYNGKHSDGLDARITILSEIENEIPPADDTKLPFDWVECLKVHDGAQFNTEYKVYHACFFSLKEACFHGCHEIKCEDKYYSTENRCWATVGKTMPGFELVININPVDPCFGYIMLYNNTCNELTPMAISFSQLIQALSKNVIKERWDSSETKDLIDKCAMLKWVSE